MVLGVRVEPELERRLDQLAHELGKSRSACIREVISQYLSRHGDAAEARRQSEHIAPLEAPHWSEWWGSWSLMCWWIWIWPFAVGWSCPDPQGMFSFNLV